MKIAEEDSPGPAGPARRDWPFVETLVTVEFHERANLTEVVLTHEFFTDKETRDHHTTGWNGCFDQLAKVL